MLIILLITSFLFANDSADSLRTTRTFLSINTGSIGKISHETFSLLGLNIYYQKKSSVFSIHYSRSNPIVFGEMPYSKGVVLKHSEAYCIYNFNLKSDSKSRNLFLIGTGIGIIFQRQRNERLYYENWSTKKLTYMAFPINFSYNHLGKNGIGSSINVHFRRYNKHRIVGFSLGINFGS